MSVQAWQAPNPEVVEIFARAFFDDPAVQWWFPDTAIRTAQLHWLYSFYTRLKSEACVRDHDGPAAAIWYPPRHPPRHTLWAELRSGLLTAPFSIGWSTTFRGLALDAAIQRRLSFVQQPCWYLDTLAVHPDAQGQGKGSALLRHGLSRAGELPVYLFTVNGKDLPFYERHGFGIVGQSPVVEDGPMAWNMMRGPSPL